MVSFTEINIIKHLWFHSYICINIATYWIACRWAHIFHLYCNKVTASCWSLTRHRRILWGAGVQFNSIFTCLYECSFYSTANKEKCMCLNAFLFIGNGMKWMFSLICALISGWVNNRETGDSRRNRAHYGVTVMKACLLINSHLLFICGNYWMLPINSLRVFMMATLLQHRKGLI